MLLLLPDEDILNVDEEPDTVATRSAGGPGVSVPKLYTLYRIDAHRNAEVLMNTLGEEFDGILGCDYFSAYRRYMKKCDIRVQFCLAHLIRDVKFLTTLPDPADRSYGEALRAALEEAVRGVPSTRATQQGGVSATAGKRLGGDTVVRLGLSAPPTRHWPEPWRSGFAGTETPIFTFVTTPGVEPTNNLAEQAIRTVVSRPGISRKGRGANRAGSGARRIWTVIANSRPAGQVGVWLFA